MYNRLQQIHIGASVQVATPSGVLTYRVFQTKTYPKPDVLANQQIYKDVRNRLVLATCKLKANGGVQTANFVAWAKLVHSTKQ